MCEANSKDFDPNQPGARRLLDAIRQLKEESPSLLDEVVPLAVKLGKTRNDGGPAPR